MLGEHGVGLEGGGVFTTPESGYAHFLVEEGEKAQKVLFEAGFDVCSVSRPLIRKLPQQRPGELGEIANTLAHAAGPAARVWTGASDVII